MLKVLYLLNHAGKGGTEQYVRILTEAFHGKKAKCFFAYNEEGPLVEQMKELGAEVFQIEMKHPFDIQAAKILSDLCKKFEIDIIHTQFLRENYIAILSKMFNANVQVVYTNHFILYNGIIHKITNRFMIPYTKAVIAVCNKGKEVMICNGFPERKIEVIFNGVDYETEEQVRESNIREEFGIDEDTFVFLNLSRFSPEKGLDFLVRSIAKLRDQTSINFKCLLVGDGPLYNEIQELVSGLNLDDVIIFTGFRTDIKNIVRGCDLFINSSSNEALSFAILESLAQGVPVVATNVGGNSDIISEENDCGLLIPFGDEAAMADALKRIMDEGNLYKRFSENSLKAIKEKFNIQSMLEKTYDLYI